MPMQEFNPHLDAQDPFPSLKHLFELPKDYIYLNGNSLGPKPKSLEMHIERVLQQWAHWGAKGHFIGPGAWADYDAYAKTSIAKIVGAKTNETGIFGHLSTNIHSLMTSFYHAQPQRYKIIYVQGFSSDVYVLRSQIAQRLASLAPFLNKSAFDITDALVEIQFDANDYIPLESIEEALAEHGSETAVLWFEAVHYQTGQWLNMAKITELAHQYGCLVGFDLAHAIGNVPLQLHDWGVDFAAWCHYKYMSAGPGAVGGLYIHEKHLKNFEGPRLCGWYGNKPETRFQMNKVFDPIVDSVQAWQISNHSVFGLSCLNASLDIFNHIDFQELRAKNMRLNAYLIKLLKENLADKLSIITPEAENEKGCQISIRVDNAAFLEEELFKEQLICDSRKQLLRITPMGLYNTFEDVYLCVEKMQRILNR